MTAKRNGFSWILKVRLAATSSKSTSLAKGYTLNRSKSPVKKIGRRSFADIGLSLMAIPPIVNGAAIAARARDLISSLVEGTFPSHGFPDPSSSPFTRFARAALLGPRDDFGRGGSRPAFVRAAGEGGAQAHLLDAGPFPVLRGHV